MTLNEARLIADDAFSCGLCSQVGCLNRGKSAFSLGCSESGVFVLCEDCQSCYVIVDGNRSPFGYRAAVMWLNEKMLVSEV